MVEAIDYLTGKRRDPRLHEVTIALAGELLALSGLTDTATAGRSKAETALGNGEPAEIFARMVAALGGPQDFLQRPETYLAAAPVIRPLPAAAVRDRAGGGRAHSRRRRPSPSAEAGAAPRTRSTTGSALPRSPASASISTMRGRSPWCMPPTRETAVAAIAELQRAYTLGAPKHKPGPTVIETVR